MTIESKVLKNGAKVDVILSDVVHVEGVKLTPLELLLLVGEACVNLAGGGARQQWLTRVVNYHIENNLVFDTDHPELMAVLSEIAASGFGEFDVVELDKITAK